MVLVGECGAVEHPGGVGQCTWESADDPFAPSYKPTVWMDS
jgi:hypothetical protein